MALNGRVDRRRPTFAGTLRLKMDVTLSDGTTDQCDSGPASFVATP
jgi:hypothetical protein